MKLRIGDIVKITCISDIYSGYDTMADSMNIKSTWDRGNRPKHLTGMISNIERHPDNKYHKVYCVAVLIKNKHYIYKNTALKLIHRTHYLDDNLFTLED